ncbi:MAG TPA: N-acetylmuramoyl-L-alanine amidase [Gaiellaceae bacterium]|nr:N-acetylmuramoyl-L-alanine amidase [Gaiellaceae bacterium]
MKLLIAVVGAMLVVPAHASAAEPTMVVRDVPLHAMRTTAAATPVFNLLGVHWRGSGSVAFRARTADGWSRWRTVDSDGRTARGWHLGNLEWTRTADAVRFRTSGSVTRLRAYYVDSPVEPIGARTLQIAGSPPILSRFSWQADESIRRAAPRYADGVHFAVVHHTAGANNYSREESAAIVRGIEVYHVKGNGWNDIGYNFLVDKYGQVFEGRYGGVDRPVVGAHAEGFNTGSVGVALIGSYGTARPAPAALASLEQLLAWRLDLAHVDPQSVLTWQSSGNPRFPSGVPVFLRAVSGHRDTGFTDCPGNALYALLPQIAKAAAAIGGPKIYAPLATQAGEGQVRFTAQLSAAQPWTVTVTSSAGVQVAQGAGTGAVVDWTWDGSSASPDRYTWTIASPDARSATGTLGQGVALAVQKAVASPGFVAPTETAVVTYTLTAPATVTATLLGSTGQPLATLLTARKPAGAQTLSFTPPPGLLNGRYTIAIAAAAGARTATVNVPFAVDDAVGGFAVTPTTATLTLNRVPVAATVELRRGATVVATQTVPLAAGPQTLTWPTPKDGAYTVALTITDDVGTLTRTLPLVVDTAPPKVTVLSYRNLRFRVNEPAVLVLTAGGRTYKRVLQKPATTQFWLKAKPRSYVLTATDLAANVTTVRYRG